MQTLIWEIHNIYFSVYYSTKGVAGILGSETLV